MQRNGAKAAGNPVALQSAAADPKSRRRQRSPLKPPRGFAKFAKQIAMLTRQHYCPAQCARRDFLSLFQSHLTVRQLF